jgi:cytochrome P450/NADPH-cytochrome P450 reductase
MINLTSFQKMLGRLVYQSPFRISAHRSQPFGTGVRACIGRAFAWQEALLVSTLLLQHFDLRLDNPNYEMSVVQTLTVKPKDFYMRATLRTGITATQLQDQLSSSPEGEVPADSKLRSQIPAPVTSERPMQILYGSNAGTCQALAQKLSAQSTQLGYNTTVTDLDSVIGKLQKDIPAIIITCSYEGQPADNAARFVAWLESCNDNSYLKGINFAVFGCGHKDWQTTFQRIPTLIDDKLSKLGATRLAERGVCDVANGDIFGDFDNWLEKHLLPSLAIGQYRTNGNLSDATPLQSLKLELSTESRAAHLQQNVQWANVTATKCLTAPGQPEKRHIEIQLPSGMTYAVGDYLAVLPINPEGVVHGVINKFGLPWDAIITITEAGGTFLPVSEPISVSVLLQGYVELSQPATRKVVILLILFLAFSLIEYTGHCNTC